MATEEPEDRKSTKTSREVLMISVVGLVGITAGSVAGLVYGVILNGESSAALVSIASLGVGSLSAILGGAAVARKPEGRKTDV